MERAPCGCYQFRVYRAGRTGHVSRKEAGVFYSGDVNGNGHGDLLVRNTLHLANPYFFCGDWTDILVCEGFVEKEQATLHNLIFKHLTKDDDSDDSWLVNCYAAAYVWDCKIADRFRAYGYDSIVYVPESWYRVEGRELTKIYESPVGQFDPEGVDNKLVTRVVVL